jgi:putative membrane protein
MIHTDPRFSQAVARKVAEIEKTTDAELVVISAAKSGSYADVAQVLAGVCSFATLGILLLLPWEVPPMLALADLVLVWALVGWVGGRHPVSARLAGESRRRAQVHAAAAAEFHQELVHATERRYGLLVYLSAWEGEVELLPDVGLQVRIPRGMWAEATTALSTADLERFLAGLDEVGKVLAEHVPATTERQVDLTNTPRIR